MMFRLSNWVRNPGEHGERVQWEQLTSRNEKCSVKLLVAGNESR